MKFRFDFSLFFSPTEPYGCVTGEIDLPSRPQPDDWVQLLEECKAGGALRLRVNSLLNTLDNCPETLMLEDLVVDGVAAAEMLGHRLRSERDFYVDVYGWC